MKENVVKALLENLWDSIKPGETVMINKTNTCDVYMGLYHLLTWARGKGYNVIVIDILDSFSLEMKKMALAGFEENLIDDTPVLKIGGSINTGKIVGKIEETTEPVILARKFEVTYDRLLDETSGRVVTIVLGLEKLLGQFYHQEKAIISVVHSFYKYVGNEKRIAFWLVKGRQLEHLAPYALDLLQDTATTVINTMREKKAVVFEVVKSVNPSLVGLKVEV